MEREQYNSPSNLLDLVNKQKFTNTSYHLSAPPEFSCPLKMVSWSSPVFSERKAFGRWHSHHSQETNEDTEIRKRKKTDQKRDPVQIRHHFIMRKHEWLSFCIHSHYKIHFGKTSAKIFSAGGSKNSAEMVFKASWNPNPKPIVMVICPTKAS